MLGCTVMPYILLSRCLLLHLLCECVGFWLFLLVLSHNCRPEALFLCNEPATVSQRRVLRGACLQKCDTRLLLMSSQLLLTGQECCTFCFSASTARNTLKNWVSLMSLRAPSIFYQFSLNILTALQHPAFGFFTLQHSFTV